LTIALDFVNNVPRFFFSTALDAKLLTAFFSAVSYLQKLLKAAGLFAGSIFLMRNFGDLMAI